MGGKDPRQQTKTGFGDRHGARGEGDRIENFFRVWWDDGGASSLLRLLLLLVELLLVIGARLLVCRSAAKGVSWGTKQS